MNIYLFLESPLLLYFILIKSYGVASKRFYQQAVIGIDTASTLVVVIRLWLL